MPFIYGLILLGVVLVGDSVSPIGQQPLWRQAIQAVTPAPSQPQVASPLYQKQLEWQQSRERKQAAAKERRRQRKRRDAIRSTSAYKTVQGYRLMREMKRNQHRIMSENFRAISSEIHRRK